MPFPVHYPDMFYRFVIKFVCKWGKQMKHRLESIRRDISKMIEAGIYDKDELIKKSQKLDMYIVEYIKKRLLNNNGTPKE